MVSKNEFKTFFFLQSLKIAPAGHKKAAPSCCFKKKTKTKTKQKKKRTRSSPPPPDMAPQLLVPFDKRLQVGNMFISDRV